MVRASVCDFGSFPFAFRFVRAVCLCRAFFRDPARAWTYDGGGFTRKARDRREDRADGIEYHALGAVFLCGGNLHRGSGTAVVVSVSLLLMLLNLLPLVSLDGGRMLGAALSVLFGVNTAERVLSLLTLVILWMLWTLSLYVFFYSGVNFMLLLFCAYLFSYIVLKKL